MSLPPYSKNCYSSKFEITMNCEMIRIEPLTLLLQRKTGIFVL